jgi:hypothetical protein
VPVVVVVVVKATVHVDGIRGELNRVCAKFGRGRGRIKGGSVQSIGMVRRWCSSHEK